MRVLFLCTSNLHRSKTAHDYFAAKLPNHDFKSAGIDEMNCMKYGGTLCTPGLLRWSDLIFAMQDQHANWIKDAEPEAMVKVVNLNVPDIFAYFDSNLIKLLDERVPALITLQSRA